MRKIWILTILAALFGRPLLADDVHISIQKTDTPPTIDAVKDAIWESARVHDEFNLIEGEPEDEFDCSPSFSVLWDETYLYYYVKVIDDYLNVDETPENLRNPGGGWGWADDCVELYLDGDNSKTAKWNEDLDAAQLWWLPFGTGIYFYQEERLHMDTTNIVYAHRETEDGLGWELEVAIPLDDAGITAEAGYIFGFEIDVGDDDGVPFSWRAEPFGGRDIKLKWFYTEDKTEPIYFGNAQLSDELVSAVQEEEPAQAASFVLSQNYPNPFNPSTTIGYALDAATRLKLDVYTLTGHHVKTVLDTFQPAGEYAVQFDGSELPSGTYLYQLRTENSVQIKKMTFLK